MTLINIPFTLASTAPTSMIPEVYSPVCKARYGWSWDKIDRATWISMFISIPCAVGLAVLAGSIYKTSVSENRRGSSAADDAWCYHYHP
ncbi:MAG: hypothetical protein V8Q57_01205 [Blautia sp.]